MKKFFTILLGFMFLFTVTSCDEGETPNSLTSTVTTEQSSTSSDKASSTETSNPTESSNPTTDLTTSLSTSTSDVPSLDAHKLFIVGDSTACSFANDKSDQVKYYPRVGFGVNLPYYLDDSLEVVNLAISGRSSRSFTREANYTTLTTSISSGDYLFIAFGHNDQNVDTDADQRYTDSNSDITATNSFKYYLYNYYIKLAIDNGATPILATPIVRRTDTGVYSGNSMHVWNSNNADFPGGDYAQCIRDLATELGVTLVDNTTSTKELHESLGTAGSLLLQARAIEKVESRDNTHTNNYGAQWVAYLIASSLKSSTNSIAKYIKDDISAPTEEEFLSINPNYVEVDYSAPTSWSDLWETMGNWHASAFGALGSAPSTTNYTVTDNGTSVYLEVKNNKGKVAGSEDGILFYFSQIDATQNFTLTATAKVDVVLSNSQVAFGLMVRDDIYIDNNVTVNTNYAAVGILDTTNPYTSWTRNNTALTRTRGGAVPAVNTVINLTLIKTGNTITVQYNNEDSANYTISLTEVDKDYVYAGVFVARACGVTFTNITLTNN